MWGDLLIWLAWVFGIVWLAVIVICIILLIVTPNHKGDDDGPDL